MAMAMASAYLLFLVFLSPKVFAKDINVGDNNGWTTGIDYSNWASSQKFNVGDKLVFTYGFTHTLDEASKGDYDNCNTGKPINSYSSSPTTITLTKAGPMYFTCPSHCSQGMKLAINVTPASTSPGGSPPTSSSPPSSTTPSPPSDTTSSPTTPDSPPSRTSTTAPPTPTSAATSIFGGFSDLMVVLVALFAFMA